MFVVMLNFIHSGRVLGYVDSLNGGIHSVECLKNIPLESRSRICSKCSTFRENILRGRLARHLKDLNSCQSVDASSHTNFLPHLKSVKG